MNKKSLTETDIRSKFITPALTGKDGEKWDLMTQIREEVYFANGRVIVRGKTVKRGEAKKADYLLYYKPNFLLAVVEAKDLFQKTEREYIVLSVITEPCLLVRRLTLSSTLDFRR